MSSPATPTARTVEISEEERLPVGAILLCGALVFAVLRQGAYHQWQHQVFAVLVGVAATAMVASRGGRTALLAGALLISPLVLSTAVSLVFSEDRSDAGSTVLEILMVGVALAVGLSIPRSTVDIAVHAILLIGLVVAATAIWGVATHSAPWGRVTEGVWRGSSSLTYANAAGSVCGPLALLAFARSALTDSRLYPVATVVLTIGFASTQSRGGALALAITGIGLIAYLGLRRAATAALPILLGVAVGTPLLLALAPSSATPNTALAVGAIGAGAALTAGAWPSRDRVGQPVLTLAALLAVSLAIGLLTGLTDPITERFTLRSGTTAQGAEAEVLFGDRAKEWSTAWSEFTERPIVGHGPGVVDLQWEEDGRRFRALFVHNEYLEFAVTHGLAGLLALTATATMAVHGTRFSQERLPLFLALSAFLLHSAVDFLWHIPALPVLFATIAGLAIAPAGNQSGDVFRQ